MAQFIVRALGVIALVLAGMVAFKLLARLAPAAPAAIATPPVQASSSAALGLNDSRTTVANDQPMSMGFTPEQFKVRFNEMAASRKVEFRVNGPINLKPVSTVADQWLYPFTDRVAFMAMVNRSDGTIRSFTYIASGNGTIESGADLMFALGALLRGIDSALPNDVVNRLTMDLVEPLQTGREVERVRNGIRYAGKHLPGVALVVAINPVQ